MSSENLIAPQIDNDNPPTPNLGGNLNQLSYLFEQPYRISGKEEEVITP